MGCGCKERRTELGHAAQALREASLERAREHLRKVRESARLDMQRLARSAFTRVDVSTNARRSD